MYRKYKSSLISNESSFDYPDYSADDDSPAGGKKAKFSTDANTTFKKYYYGKERKKPKFWERDLETNKKFLSKWKRKALDDSPRDEKPSKPPVPEVPPATPKPKPPEEEMAKALHVKDVDLHIEANTIKHRTNDYTCTEERKYQGKILPAELVVRRGDSIKITIEFDRPYEDETDDVQLIFTLGDKPTPSRGTLARFFLNEKGDRKFKPNKWGATLQDKNANKATILVNIPCNCIIGEWNFTIQTFSLGKGEKHENEIKIWQYEHDGDITILFNPWCKRDGTYMENEKHRAEYVLNDNGCVYRGNAYQVGAKEWNFGQFEEEILDIALYLVRSGFKGGVSKQMSDPVMVSRVIAKLVNCCDDNGVLVGNWSGDYADGVSPSKWSGSIKILKQWRRDGPVKYGQCWVFSCVTTTVCRAVGIPCRSVTNFASAHDTDASNCIEKFYIDKAKNEVDKYLSSDSVWNFHVWNEVWMKRPDLKDLDPQFECLRDSGWQVIDATPQELSEGGVFVCGPCPVKAVRMGYCSVKYDTDFVFAEVNSDKIIYEMQPDGEYKRTEIMKHSVGKKISTKIPDGRPYKDAEEEETNDWLYSRDNHSEKKRHDLTLDYKPEEGSVEERETVKLAQKTARNARKENYEEYIEKEVKPLEFHLTHDNNVMIGGDMKIKFTAKNVGEHERNIYCPEITVSPKTYTGDTGESILVKYFVDAVVKKGEETSFEVVLEPKDYLPKLVEQANLSIVASASVPPVADENFQVVFKEHDVRFRRPDLEVKCPKSTKKGEKVNFEVSFKNPLDIALTDCDISMESAGFKDIEDEKEADIPPKGEYRRTFCLKANKKAKQHAALTFSFDSKQLKDISGGCTIKIEE